MTANAECVVTIPLICELVPINMALRELESLAQNSYKSTTVFLHMLINVCLRVQYLSMWESLITPKYTVYLTRFVHVLLSFLSTFPLLCWCFVCVLCFQPFKSHMRINEVKWMKNERNGAVCTQGGQHGVLHGGSHLENDVYHVSTVKRLGHSPFVKMAFAIQGVALAIFCILLQLELSLLGLPIPFIFSYFSSHESSNFLMELQNSSFISLFLGTQAQHKHKP